MRELNDIYLTFNYDPEDEFFYQFSGKILVDEHKYFIGIMKSTSNILRKNYNLVLGKIDDNAFYMIKMFSDDQVVEEYSLTKNGDSNKYSGVFSIVSSECSVPVRDVRLAVFDSSLCREVYSEEIDEVKTEIERCISYLGDDSLYQYTKYHLNKFDSLDRKCGPVKIIS